MTVLVPWDKKQDPAEYYAFQAVVNTFKQGNPGVQVIIESSREPTQQLDADLKVGDQPDLVDLPSPSALYQYKKELYPLASIKLNSYDQPWRGLAELETGTVYAVPVKADVKSLLWYDTNVLPSPPMNWAALEGLYRHYTTPWCLGLASGSTSGWPGADWVADILLHSNPVSTYTRWLDGDLPWTYHTVMKAWSTWGMLMRHGTGINGGAPGALETAFNDAHHEIASGRCELEHGALSATGLSSTARYGYVPFPSTSGKVSPILVSGDFMGLFTRNPNAEKLLCYLASDKAQTLWVQQGGYAFSADQAVAPAAYPADVQQSIVRNFLQPGGTTLCFSAEDMMQPDVSTAFEHAVLYYVNDPTSANLQALLNGMQETQTGAGAGASPLADHACASP